jgi:hypothetical protein
MGTNGSVTLSPTHRLLPRSVGEKSEHRTRQGGGGQRDGDPLPHRADRSGVTSDVADQRLPRPSGWPPTW